MVDIYFCMFLSKDADYALGKVLGFLLKVDLFELMPLPLLSLLKVPRDATKVAAIRAVLKIGLF